MSENVDQLKALELDARQNLSTNHVSLYGLDELRAYQRGELVPPPMPKTKRRFTEDEIRDMTLSSDPTQVVAARNKTTQKTVRRYRKLRDK